MAHRRERELVGRCMQLIDAKVIEVAILAGLPAQARWTIGGTPLDYDFSAARHGLRTLPDYVLEGGDPAWSELLVFGDYDYAEGGGAHPWLCVHQRHGTIHEFDPELEERPVSLLNSSIDQFIKTFLFLDEYLAENKRGQLPLDCERRVQEIDPEAYQKSDWRLLVEHIRSM